MAMSLKQRKTRDKEGLYLIEGFNICREALAAGAEFDVIFLRQSLAESEENHAYKEAVDSIINTAEEMDVEVLSLEDGIFDKIMETETPQGIGALIRSKRWDDDGFFQHQREKGKGNLLVLDRIQDPGNVGTMVRTAEAAGFTGIISLKGTVDIYSPKVVRSAAGSIFRMAFLFSHSPEEAIDLLRKNKKKIVVATPYCEKYHFNLKLDKDIALVIGNEGGGVSQPFLREADCRVKIPMSETVESLNAAVAASIIMYESTRQNFHKEAEEQ
jgi:TrmH family RNA methyltransferase